MMNPKKQIYSILQDVVNGFVLRDPSVKQLPEEMQPAMPLADLGIDVTNLPEIIGEVKVRLAGKDLRLGQLFQAEELNQSTIGELVDLLASNLDSDKDRKLVVYVDDEEENLFIFRRRFQKDLDLKLFTSSLEALAFIKSNPHVGLVITDEVMPKMGGNELCDEVKKVKPFMKFLLITGNPNQDEDLLYHSLRGNKFYDFLQKPVDFAARGDEILNTINGLINFNW